MSKKLIFSAVGDKSFHKKWLDKNQDFDVMLVYYGNNAEISNDYQKDCNYFFQEKTNSKFAILQKILIENLDIFNKYDYVWVPDDDLDISYKDIETLFSMAEEHNLWICQPSITENITMNFVKNKPGSVIRFVSFVEQMAPLFKRDILLYLGSTFDATESLWGVEHVWNALLKSPKDKIAIIDKVSAKHMKKVGTDYSRFKIHPTVEIDIIKDEYKRVLDFPESIDLIEYNIIMEEK
jgi:hypothetical protein